MPQSPLLVATDVRNLTAVMRAVLLNAELIAIHQATLTPPGRLLKGRHSGTPAAAVRAGGEDGSQADDASACEANAPCAVWAQTGVLVAMSACATPS